MWILRGRILQDQGEREEATRSFQTGLELLIESEDFYGAHDIIEYILEVEPENYMTLLGKAMCL